MPQIKQQTLNFLQDNKNRTIPTTQRPKDLNQDTTSTGSRNNPRSQNDQLQTASNMTQDDVKKLKNELQTRSQRTHESPTRTFKSNSNKLEEQRSTQTGKQQRTLPKSPLRNTKGCRRERHAQRTRLAENNEGNGQEDNELRKKTKTKVKKEIIIIKLSYWKFLRKTKNIFSKISNQTRKHTTT